MTIESLRLNATFTPLVPFIPPEPTSDNFVSSSGDRFVSSTGEVFVPADPSP